MSDVYLSRERVAQLAQFFALQAREVEQGAAQLPGGQFGDLKEQGLAVSGALARIAEQLAAGSLEGGAQRREVGVNTCYKIRHYAPNRGRL